MKTIDANQTHLLKRMMELRDWAEFIEASVTRDQSFEIGKYRLLMELADPRALRDVQDRSKVLLIALNRLIEGLNKSVSAM